MAQNADEVAVTAALQKAGGSMARSTLGKQLGLSRERLGQALSTLRSRGEVTSTQGRSPVYTLNPDYKPPAASEGETAAFLKALRALGGRTTNKRLMQRLKWETDAYYEIRNALLDDGVIRKARGRGGVVELESEEPVMEPEAVAPAELAETKREADLYNPIKGILEGEWAKEIRLDSDHLHVEITAHQGRKATGGIWTRPDLTVLSFHKFKHLPDPVFDLITLEVKPQGKMDITAIYEAAAHGRFATRSFAFFQVPADFEATGDEPFQECLKEADRYGIGVITSSKVGDFETWETHSEGKRRAPDPIVMDDFIARQVSPEGKEKLAAWYAKYWRERVKNALT